MNLKKTELQEVQYNLYFVLVKIIDKEYMPYIDIPLCSYILAVLIFHINLLAQ
ncbi:hypothetical protein WN55_11272 [Dufourea novaeangliae]|uniref:Uncharacterized protein n=1 Tax=Dufourea novaeangliae TaxID=178035 RepID=A0A154P9W3_DUFNO|nr:hypothetical protein WN55_11272 [Dufourea novaeangliae]